MRSLSMILTLACLALPAQAQTLKIYILGGQSNMQGVGATYENAYTAPSVWNFPTMEYLLDNPAYMATLPNNIFTFKPALNPSWYLPRSDVWAGHYSTFDASAQKVVTGPDTDPTDCEVPAWNTGIQPLSPGFGFVWCQAGDGISLFGAELALGHRLGDVMTSPILLLKVCHGGTTLGTDWRPPTAVLNRGGVVGPNYTNAVSVITSVLDDLDADLLDDGVLNTYGGATGYEIAGLVWIQGTSDFFLGGTHVSEYGLNLIDLVNDLRASDPRYGATLPAVVVEGADQDPAMNAERAAAVSALNSANPGSAVFIETNGMINVNYGGLNSEGNLFADSWWIHYHNRPENYLQMGWSAGDAILANGFTGDESVVGTRPDPIGTTLQLRAAPSPFSASTTLSFFLPTAVDRVNVSVYDLRGRQVLRHSVRGVPGWNEFVWDGESNHGSVAAGVYYLDVNAGPHRASQRVVRH